MKYRMDEITESCLGKMLDAKKNKGEYQPYLANINVRWGSFDLEKLSLMRFEKDEEERYGIKYGDLIMCEGGEPGRCAIWRDELPNMKIQKALHRIRPNTNLVDALIKTIETSNINANTKPKLKNITTILPP